MDPHPANTPLLPLKVLEIILTQIYLSSLVELEQNSLKAYGSGSESRHYCSLARSCSSARPFISSFCDLRLVSREWDRAFVCVKRAHPFFQRLEDAFYPYPWHVNSKVRSYSISGRYRVFGTFQANSDQGVFLAHDYSGSGGCGASREVVIKAFQNPAQPELATERVIYNQFRAFERADGIRDGISSMVETGHDPMCGVDFIAMPRLGPSLEDLIELIPGGRLTPRMVVAVAFQLICRLEELHRRGVVHNGIKPANICLCPKDAARSAPGTLWIIDFGLSYTLPGPGTVPRHADPKGNRSFLSLWAHHGITQCQRDDLESLVYLLSYLQRGPLPWERNVELTHSDEYQPRPHTWQLKALTSAKDLFKEMDEAFMLFFKEVKALAFAEVPNYAALKGLFRDAWTRMVSGEVDIWVDWWDVWERLRKGENLSSIDAVPSQAEIPVATTLQIISMTLAGGAEIRTPSKRV